MNNNQKIRYYKSPKKRRLQELAGIFKSKLLLENVSNITELDFPDEKALALYSKRHEIHPNTVVTVAGKKATVPKTTSTSDKDYDDLEDEAADYVLDKWESLTGEKFDPKRKSLPPKIEDFVSKYDLDLDDFMTALKDTNR